MIHEHGQSSFLREPREKEEKEKEREGARGPGGWQIDGLWVWVGTDNREQGNLADSYLGQDFVGGVGAGRWGVG